MARETPASSKEVFRIIVDGSTATAALAQPAIVTSLPSAAVDTGDWPLARLRFGGTDAENETINYQVVLWFRFETGTGTAYIPLVAAKGAATLGALTYGVGTAIGAAGNLFADTITDTLGHRGSFVTSPASDSIAELEVDLRNAEAIEVEVDLGTAATSDVLLQFGEMVSAAGDVDVEANLGNVGLLDSSETEIDPAIKGEQQILTSAPVAKTPVIGVKVVATAGTAVAIVAAETFARACVIQAKLVAGPNTGAVHIGLSALDMGVAEVFELAPGDTLDLGTLIPAGTKLNLALIYVDADTSADGITFIYTPV